LINAVAFTPEVISAGDPAATSFLHEKDNIPIINITNDLTTIITVSLQNAIEGNKLNETGEELLKEYQEFGYCDM
jgi:hypothetical protein